MGEKRVVVPEGMYDAAMKYQDSGIQCGAALEAALRWLSENPIVPSVEQCDAIRDVLGPREDLMQWQVKEVAFEWQRRIFLAPEPEMIGEETLDRFCARFRTIGEAALEAYRLGQQSREK